VSFAVRISARAGVGAELAHGLALALERMLGALDHSLNSVAVPKAVLVEVRVAVAPAQNPCVANVSWWAST